ncbi:hypothetical protein [Natrinema sp. H-ect4]|uniref:hypothetical protein n=1 Tax=Natrinema sp. H-ect4 TaxID=3242699 RepID=UPI0035A8E433
MRMNRRNVLVGLGTIVAGGGAALGTGAFSSVEAERTANISTVGDASGYLAIEAHPNSSDDSATPNDPDTTSDGSPYLTLSSDDELSFNFDGSGDPSTSASGLNRNALSKFGDLLQITNNGPNSVNLDVELRNSSSNTTEEDSVFTAYISQSSPPTGGSEGDSVDGSVTLSSGDTLDIGFEIDLRDLSGLDSSKFTDSKPQSNYGENVATVAFVANQP